MAGNMPKDSSWARVLADGNKVIKLYHEAQGFTEPNPDTQGFSLDAGTHAGLIPFDPNGPETSKMMDRYRKAVEKFNLEDSSFAALLDKRRFIFQKFFAHLTEIYGLRMEKLERNASKTSPPAASSRARASRGGRAPYHPGLFCTRGRGRGRGGGYMHHTSRGRGKGKKKGKGGASYEQFSRGKDKSRNAPRNKPKWEEAFLQDILSRKPSEALIKDRERRTKEMEEHERQEREEQERKGKEEEEAKANAGEEKTKNNDKKDDEEKKKKEESSEEPTSGEQTNMKAAPTSLPSTGKSPHQNATTTDNPPPQSAGVLVRERSERSKRGRFRHIKVNYWAKIAGPHSSATPPDMWNGGKGPSMEDVERIAIELKSFPPLALDASAPSEQVTRLVNHLLKEGRFVNSNDNGSSRGAGNQEIAMESFKRVVVAVALSLSLAHPSLIVRCTAALERLQEGLGEWNMLLGKDPPSECLVSALQNIEAMQQQLDVSVPLRREECEYWVEEAASAVSSEESSRDTHSNRTTVVKIPSQHVRPAPTTAHALAASADSRYLYLHSSAGIQKIGTGLRGSKKGRIYATNKYQPSESVRIVWLAGRIYAMREHPTWPQVDVFDGSSLEAVGTMRLGLNPEVTWASLQKEAKTIGFGSDGRHLYVGVQEPISRNSRVVTPGMRDTVVALGLVVDVWYHGRWEKGQIIAINTPPELTVVVKNDAKKKKRKLILGVTVMIPGHSRLQMLEEVALLAYKRRRAYDGRPEHDCPMIADERPTHSCDTPSCRARGTSYRCANGCDHDYCAKCWALYKRRNVETQIQNALRVVEKEIAKQKLKAMEREAAKKKSSKSSLHKKSSSSSKDAKTNRRKKKGESDAKAAKVAAEKKEDITKLFFILYKLKAGGHWVVGWMDSLKEAAAIIEKRFIYGQDTVEVYTDVKTKPTARYFSKDVYQNFRKSIRRIPERDVVALYKEKPEPPKPAPETTAGNTSEGKSKGPANAEVKTGDGKKKPSENKSNPPSSPAAPAVSPSSGQWSCGTCTVKNSPAVAVCSVCGIGERPPGVAAGGNQSGGSVGGLMDDFKHQLVMLHAMGFSDDRKNLAALVACSGNVANASALLLEGDDMAADEDQAFAANLAAENALEAAVFGSSPQLINSGSSWAAGGATPSLPSSPAQSSMSQGEDGKGGASSPSAPSSAADAGNPESKEEAEKKSEPAKESDAGDSNKKENQKKEMKDEVEGGAAVESPAVSTPVKKEDSKEAKKDKSDNDASKADKQQEQKSSGSNEEKKAAEPLLPPQTEQKKKPPAAAKQAAPAAPTKPKAGTRAAPKLSKKVSDWDLPLRQFGLDGESGFDGRGNEKSSKKSSSGTIARKILAKLLPPGSLDDSVHVVWYVFDPVRPLLEGEATVRESEPMPSDIKPDSCRAQEMKDRKAKALELRKSMCDEYSLEQCLLMLIMAKGDTNKAASLLLSHGVRLKGQKVAPLSRMFILKDKDNGDDVSGKKTTSGSGSGSSSPTSPHTKLPWQEVGLSRGGASGSSKSKSTSGQFFTHSLLSKVRMYITGKQIVILAPANTWGRARTQNSRFPCRIYSVATGQHIADHFSDVDPALSSWVAPCGGGGERIWMSKQQPAASSDGRNNSSSSSARYAFTAFWNLGPHHLVDPASFSPQASNILWEAPFPARDLVVEANANAAMKQAEAARRPSRCFTLTSNKPARSHTRTTDFASSAQAVLCRVPRASDITDIGQALLLILAHVDRLLSYAEAAVYGGLDGAQGNYWLGGLRNHPVVRAVDKARKWKKQLTWHHARKSIPRHQRGVHYEVKTTTWVSDLITMRQLGDGDGNDEEDGDVGKDDEKKKTEQKGEGIPVEKEDSSKSKAPATKEKQKEETGQKKTRLQAGERILVLERDPSGLFRIAAPVAGWIRQKDLTPLEKYRIVNERGLGYRLTRNLSDRVDEENDVKEGFTYLAHGREITAVYRQGDWIQAPNDFWLPLFISNEPQVEMLPIPDPPPKPSGEVKEEGEGNKDGANNTGKNPGKQPSPAEKAAEKNAGEAEGKEKKKKEAKSKEAKVKPSPAAKKEEQKGDETSGKEEKGEKNKADSPSQVEDDGQQSSKRRNLIDTELSRISLHLEYAEEKVRAAYLRRYSNLNASSRYWQQYQVPEAPMCLLLETGTFVALRDSLKQGLDEATLLCERQEGADDGKKPTKKTDAEQGKEGGETRLVQVVYGITVTLRLLAAHLKALVNARARFKSKSKKEPEGDEEKQPSGAAGAAHSSKQQMTFVSQETLSEIRTLLVRALLSMPEGLPGDGRIARNALRVIAVGLEAFEPSESKRCAFAVQELKACMNLIDQKKRLPLERRWLLHVALAWVAKNARTGALVETWLPRGKLAIGTKDRSADAIAGKDDDTESKALATNDVSSTTAARAAAETAISTTPLEYLLRYSCTMTQQLHEKISPVVQSAMKKSAALHSSSERAKDNHSLKTLSSSPRGAGKGLSAPMYNLVGLEAELVLLSGWCVTHSNNLAAGASAAATTFKEDDDDNEDEEEEEEEDENDNNDADNDGDDGDNNLDVPAEGEGADEKVAEEEKKKKASEDADRKGKNDDDDAKASSTKKEKKRQKQGDAAIAAAGKRAKYAASYIKFARVVVQQCEGSLSKRISLMKEIKQVKKHKELTRSRKSSEKKSRSRMPEIAEKADMKEKKGNGCGDAKSDKYGQKETEEAKSPASPLVNNDDDNNENDIDDCDDDSMGEVEQLFFFEGTPLLLLPTLLASLDSPRLLQTSSTVGIKKEEGKEGKSKVTAVGSFSSSSTTSNAAAAPSSSSSLSQLKELYPCIRSLLTVADTYNRMVKGARAEDQRFMQRLRNEQPRAQIAESDHPYGAGNSIPCIELQVPGASALAVSFDPRSCTKSKQDMVRVIAGSKAAQFSGNSLYYDAPRDFPSKCSMVLTKTNSVTINLRAISPPEVKKERKRQEEEDSQARWGFRASVRGIVLPSLSWHLDLQLSAASLAAKMAVSQLTFKSHPLDSELHLWFTKEGAHLLAGGVRSYRAFHPPEISPRDKFFLSFINGTTGAASLLEYISKLKFRSSKRNAMLRKKRYSRQVQQAWLRALRAVMASMFYHAGLHAEIHRHYGPKSDQRRTPLLDRKVVDERINGIAERAEELQTWMYRELQVRNLWEELVDSKDRPTASDVRTKFTAADIESFCRLARVPYAPNAFDASVDRLTKAANKLHEDKMQMKNKQGGEKTDASAADKGESDSTGGSDLDRIKARKETVTARLCAEISDLCMALLLLQPAWMPPSAAPIVSVTDANTRTKRSGSTGRKAKPIAIDTSLPPSQSELQLSRTLSAFRMTTRTMSKRTVALPEMEEAAPDKEATTSSESKAAATVGNISSDASSTNTNQQQLPSLPPMARPALKRVYTDLPTRKNKAEIATGGGGSPTEQGVAELREWINNFRRWKQWNEMEENAVEENLMPADSQRQGTTPEDAIELMIKHRVHGEDIILLSKVHEERGKRCNTGLRWLIECLDSVKTDSSRIQLLGHISSVLFPHSAAGSRSAGGNVSGGGSSGSNGNGSGEGGAPDEQQQQQQHKQQHQGMEVLATSAFTMVAPGTVMCPTSLRSQIADAFDSYHARACRLVAGKAPVDFVSGAQAKSPVAAIHYLESLRNEPDRPTIASQFMALKDAMCMPLFTRDVQLVAAHQRTFTTVSSILFADLSDSLSKQRRLRERGERRGGGARSAFSIVYQLRAGGYWIVKSSSNFDEIASHVRQYMADDDSYLVFWHKAKDWPQKRYLPLETSTTKALLSTATKTAPAKPAAHGQDAAGKTSPTSSPSHASKAAVASLSSSKYVRISESEALSGILSARTIATIADDQNAYATAAEPKKKKNNDSACFSPDSMISEDPLQQNGGNVMGYNLLDAQYAAFMSLAWRAVRSEWRACSQKAAGSLMGCAEELRIASELVDSVHTELLKLIKAHTSLATTRIYDEDGDEALARTHTLKDSQLKELLSFLLSMLQQSAATNASMASLSYPEHMIPRDSRRHRARAFADIARCLLVLIRGYYQDEEKNTGCFTCSTETLELSVRLARRLWPFARPNQLVAELATKTTAVAATDNHHSSSSHDGTDSKSGDDGKGKDRTGVAEGVCTWLIKKIGMLLVPGTPAHSKEEDLEQEVADKETKKKLNLLEALDQLAERIKAREAEKEKARLAQEAKEREERKIKAAAMAAAAPIPRLSKTNSTSSASSSSSSKDRKSIDAKKEKKESDKEAKMKAEKKGASSPINEEAGSNKNAKKSPKEGEKKAPDSGAASESKASADKKSAEKKKKEEKKSEVKAQPKKAAAPQDKKKKQQPNTEETKKRAGDRKIAGKELPIVPPSAGEFCLVALKQGPSPLPGMPPSWMAKPETLDEEDWENMFRKFPEVTAPTRREWNELKLHSSSSSSSSGEGKGAGPTYWECVCLLDLNFRNGPSLKHVACGKISRGNTVQEIERQGDWLKHKHGWSLIRTQGVECLRRVPEERVKDLAWSTAAYQARLRYRPQRQPVIRHMNAQPKITGYSFELPALPSGSAASSSSSVMANVRSCTLITGGKWYFEVQIIAPGKNCFRVGIAAKNFHPRDHFGAGQHGATWVYDAMRGIKMNDGSSKSYGAKCKVGDVIGVRLDMTRHTLRFYLNSQDLGVAFEDFSPRGGVYPVVCFDRGAIGQFLFPKDRWLSDPKCWGGYHYPLLNDHPGLQLKPPTRASRKARKVVRELEQHRAAIIAEGSYQWCCSVGARLAAAAGSGASITLASTRSAEVFAASAKTRKLSRFSRLRVIDGLSAHIAASELVGLCRSLVKGNRLSSASGSEEEGEDENYEVWQKCMRQALARCIKTKPVAAATTTSSSLEGVRATIGALAILGGFSEPVRRGGFVMAPSSGRKRRAALVEYRGRHAEEAKLVFQDKKSMESIRLSRANSSRRRMLRRGSTQQLPPLHRANSNLSVQSSGEAGGGRGDAGGALGGVGSLPSMNPQLVRTSSTRSAISVAPDGEGGGGGGVGGVYETEIVSVKTEDITPISELYVDLQEFPLKPEIFAALRSLVMQEEAADSEQLQGDKKKNGKQHGGSSSSSSSCIEAWLRSELRWRSVGVLESLLMHTENLDHSLGRELYSGIAQLLLRHAASCPRNDQLLPQMHQYDLLRRQLCKVCSPSLRNRICPPPFQPSAVSEGEGGGSGGGKQQEAKAKAAAAAVAQAQEAAVKAELSSMRYVYGGPAHLTQRSGRELRPAENPMLEHYDTYVIPRIRFILRDDENFQNDLVLGDHMEQIRKPLSTDPDPQRAAMKAMKVAFEILNNGWVSELVYPSPAYDWTLLAAEKARVGDAVEITNRPLLGVLSTKRKDPRIRNLVGLSGHIKGIFQHQRDVQMLVQVYDPRGLFLYDLWLPPSCLRPLELGQLVTQIRGMFSQKELLSRLADRALSVSHLLARRVIFTLCSRSTEPFQAQLLRSPNEQGLQAIFDMLFLAVSEGVEFSSLERLGRAKPGRKAGMLRLSYNLSRFLSSAPLAKVLGWKSELDRGRTLIRLIVERCAAFLSTSKNYEKDNTAFVKVGDNWQTAARIGSIEGAAVLSVMLSTEIKLQPGMTVSFYADPMCSRLVKIIRVNAETKGEDCLDQLQPLELPGNECWVKVQHVPPYQCRARICAIPVHSSLGMAIWSIRYALAHGEEWGSSRRAIAFEFLSKVLELLDVDNRRPSPLKQRLLSLSLWLLAQGGSEGSQEEEEKNKQVKRKCLAMLRRFEKELERLYQVESDAGGEYTLYLQKIVDMLVTSEPLRAADDKLVKSFDIKAPAELEEGKDDEPEEEEEEEEQEWSCGICTFLNANEIPACNMCGSPKPPPQPKKKAKAAGGGAEGGDGAAKLVHDSMVLANAMRYVSNPTTTATALSLSSSSSSVKALFDAGWRALQLDKISSRVLVIENIPVVLPPPRQVEVKAKATTTAKEESNSGGEVEKRTPKEEKTKEKKEKKTAKAPATTQDVGGGGGEKKKQRKRRKKRATKVGGEKKIQLVDPEVAIREAVLQAIKGADPGCRITASDVHIFTDPSKPVFVPPKPIEDSIPVLTFTRSSTAGRRKKKNPDDINYDPYEDEDYDYDEDDDEDEDYDEDENSEGEEARARMRVDEKSKKKSPVAKEDSKTATATTTTPAWESGGIFYHLGLEAAAELAKALEKERKEKEIEEAKTKKEQKEAKDQKESKEAGEKKETKEEREGGQVQKGEKTEVSKKEEGGKKEEGVGKAKDEEIPAAKEDTVDEGKAKEGKKKEEKTSGGEEKQQSSSSSTSSLKTEKGASSSPSTSQSAQSSKQPQFISPAAPDRMRDKRTCFPVAVGFSSSDSTSAPTHMVLSRTPLLCGTSSSHPEPGSILIRIKDGRRIVPTGYSILTLRQRHPRRWVLQASCDNNEWTDLHEARSPRYTSVPDAALETPTTADTKTNKTGGGAATTAAAAKSGGSKSGGKPLPASSSPPSFLKSSKNAYSSKYGNGYIREKTKGLGGVQQQQQQLLPPNSCQTVYYPIVSPEGRGWTHFRIKMVGKNSSNGHQLTLCGFEMFGQLGGPSLGVVPEPLPTNRVAMIMLPTSDKARRRHMVEKMTETIIDCSEFGGRSAPRRVQLISQPLNAGGAEQPGTDGHRDLLSMYARAQFIPDFGQPSLDEKKGGKEDNGKSSQKQPNERLETAANFALIALSKSNAAKLESKETSLLDLAKSCGSGVLRAHLSAATSSPSASGRATLAAQIAQILDRLSRSGKSDDIFKAMEWLDGAGISLNLEPHRILSLEESQAMIEAMKQKELLFSSRRLIAVLQRAADECGEPNLLKFPASQIPRDVVLHVLKECGGLSNNSHDHEGDDGKNHDKIQQHESVADTKNSKTLAEAPVPASTTSRQPSSSSSPPPPPSLLSTLASFSSSLDEYWEVAVWIRLRLEGFRTFNALFAELYPLLHNELPDEEEDGEEIASSTTATGTDAVSDQKKNERRRQQQAIAVKGMASLIRSSRGVVFESVKRVIEKDLMESTASEPLGGGRPSFVLNRVALARKLEAGEAADFVTDSQFASAYRQLFSVSPFDLRPVRPGGTEPFVAFEVKTEGENVVGLAGPYRQFFTEIARELMSEASPLLVPTPNRAYGNGENRDRYLLDPGARSTKLLSMLEFLGRLFAMAMRTGSQVPVALAPLVWKLLVRQPVVLGDLHQVDCYAAAALRGLRNLSKNEDAASSLPEELADQKFVVTLSDGSSHQLKPGGYDLRVTDRNRNEYVRLATRARLSEQNTQIAAVRKGIGSIIPVQLLSLLSWEELEVRVCGKNEIDVEILKRHTKYSGVQPDAKHIKFFWKMLEEFNQEHRRDFVRFCWAQERLPASDAEFERTKTRFQIKASVRSGNPDSILPTADTCFFNLSLPAYSSYEIMKTKVLYAIEQVTTMDKDEGMDVEGVGQVDEEEE